MEEDILAEIVAKKDSLTKKEQKLANYILNNPEKVIDLSIHKLARSSDVSAATIVRFCHSLNVKGYSQLRLLLSAQQGSDIDAPYQEITAGESVENVIKKMGIHFETVVRATQAGLSGENILKTITLLHKAPQIETFGVGAAGIVAQDFYQKMMRIGRDISYFVDFHMALTQAVNLPEQSVVVLFSNSGKTTEIIELMKTIKESGKDITLVLVSSDKNSAAGKLADIILINQDLGESKMRLGATTSTVSQMFVVDVLLFSYSARYLNEVKDNINESKVVVDRYKMK